MANTRATHRSRLARLHAKRDALLARRRQLESHLSYVERKQRTRRLIQAGALAEKYLGVEQIPDLQALLALIAATCDESGGLLLDALRPTAEDAVWLASAEAAAIDEIAHDVRPERA